MRNHIFVAVAKRWATAMLVAGLAWAGCASANFINQGNGTILDTTTNLVWEQNANHGPFNWAGAVNYANTLALAGGGWHLPLIGELQGLYNDLKAAGVCVVNCTGDKGGFTGIQLEYWSGTEAIPGTFAKLLLFDLGIVLEFDESSHQLPVWAVRSGNVAAVPEPQTVALLLAGLGLIGWRTRRDQPQ